MCVLTNNHVDSEMLDKHSARLHNRINSQQADKLFAVVDDTLLILSLLSSEANKSKEVKTYNLNEWRGSRAASRVMEGLVAASIRLLELHLLSQFSPEAETTLLLLTGGSLAP